MACDLLAVDLFGDAGLQLDMARTVNGGNAGPPVHSLEAQDIACPEQDVLIRAIQTLSAVHDWLHDRMWSETEAERARISRDMHDEVGASLTEITFLSELARRVGMSRDGLYKALSADGNPTWYTILKVTNALGLRFELHPAAS